MTYDQWRGVGGPEEGEHYSACPLHDDNDYFDDLPECLCPGIYERSEEEWRERKGEERNDRA